MLPYKLRPKGGVFGRGIAPVFVICSAYLLLIILLMIFAMMRHNKQMGLGL
jgi:hypothetical protein